MSNQLNLIEGPIRHQNVKAYQKAFDGFLFSPHAEGFQGEVPVLSGDTQSLQIGVKVAALASAVEESSYGHVVASSFYRDHRGQ